MSTIKNPDVITILATGGTIDKFYSVAGTLDIQACRARCAVESAHRYSF